MTRPSLSLGAVFLTLATLTLSVSAPATAQESSGQLITIKSDRGPMHDPAPLGVLALLLGRG